MTNYAGQQLGNYRLIRFIGQGSFADVYLAEHIHLESLAAIKVLHIMLSDEYKDAFVTEARRLVRLRHSHIVRLLEFGIEGETPFLVMEYASNGSLHSRHPKGSQVSLEAVVSYAKQVADALQYIHEQKLVHRDIKPANMLLGPNLEVLVSDLGVATVAHSTSSLSLQTMAGTVPYIAPETIQGQPRPASDQYALGIVVYEWLCGDRPFRGSVAELYNQHLFVPPPSLCAKVPELPPSVEEVVLTALAKDPEQRFASVQAFAVALEQASLLKQIHSSTSTLEERVSNSATPLPQKVNSSQLSSLPMQVNTGSEAANPTRVNEHFELPTLIPSIPPNEFTKLPIPLAWSEAPPHNLATNQLYDIKSVVVDARSSVTRHEINNQSPSIGGGRGDSLYKLRRRLLTIVLILLIGIIVLTAISQINPISNFLSGASLSPPITAKDLKNTYAISAVTEMPNASQHQVQARLLSYSTPPQSKTVNATGVEPIAGIQATGKLTFYNGSLRQQTVAIGTIFQGADGVQVVNDELAIIPAAKPPAEGSVTVSAHAVDTGIKGNVKALDIHLTCCVSGDFILVENLLAFRGGQDEKYITVVQQSDIDGVVDPLTQSANTSLQSQIRPNERLVSPSQCTSKVSSNLAVGDKVTNVTVTARVVCTSEVYDQRAALTMAENLLKLEATSSLGPGYTLTGNVLTAVTQAKVVDTEKGTVSLLVKAEGIWISKRI